MILVISILLFLVAEAWWEAIHGDNHGLKSNLLLLGMALTQEVVGLNIGVKYGFLLYWIFRFGLFDYLFSYFRYGYIWFLGKTSTIDKWQRDVKVLLVKAISWASEKFKFSLPAKPIVYSKVTTTYNYSLLVLRIVTIFAVTIHLI